MSEGFGLNTCRRKLKVMSGTSSKKGRTTRMKMGYRRWLGQLDNTYLEALEDLEEHPEELVLQELRDGLKAK